jgi:hypothetical protein
MGTTLTLRVWVGSLNSRLSMQRKCRGPVKNISLCYCISHLYSSPFDRCRAYYTLKVKFLYSFNQPECSGKYWYWLACKSHIYTSSQDIFNWRVSVTLQETAECPSSPCVIIDKVRTVLVIHQQYWRQPCDICLGHHNAQCFSAFIFTFSNASLRNVTRDTDTDTLKERCRTWRLLPGIKFLSKDFQWGDASSCGFVRCDAMSPNISVITQKTTA